MNVTITAQVEKLLARRLHPAHSECVPPLPAVVHEDRGVGDCLGGANGALRAGKALLKALARNVVTVFRDPGMHA